MVFIHVVMVLTPLIPVLAVLAEVWLRNVIQFLWWVVSRIRIPSLSENIDSLVFDLLRGYLLSKAFLKAAEKIRKVVFALIM